MAATFQNVAPALVAAAISFGIGRATAPAPAPPVEQTVSARPRSVCVCTVGQRRYIEPAAASAAEYQCDAQPPEISPLTGKNRRGPILCF